MKEKVYYCKDVTKEKLVEMYKKLGKELKGNVAVKLHSGEDGKGNGGAEDQHGKLADTLGIFHG